MQISLFSICVLAVITLCAVPTNATPMPQFLHVIISPHRFVQPNSIEKADSKRFNNHLSGLEDGEDLQPEKKVGVDHWFLVN